jgi:hypothetical protein
MYVFFQIIVVMASSPSSLSAALPSTYEQDEALVRSNSDPTTMTDEQAKAIIEAANRLFLRNYWAGEIDKECNEGYTDDVVIYPDAVVTDPVPGRESLRPIAVSLYGDGTLFTTKLDVLEVFRAGNYLNSWSTCEESDSSQGYSMAMWRFENGRWRRMRVIFNTFH